MRKKFINEDDQNISVREQLSILQINRSSYYYQAKIDYSINPDHQLMIRIDLIFEEHPYYGSRRMTTSLKIEGHNVNRKRVRRLMKIMLLFPIYPKPNLSKRNQEHKVFPYLLRNMDISQTDQVWATDITYIPMSCGHVYLTAVIDWFSRKILSWKISTTLDTSFCIDVLKEAANENSLPQIFNTDQGSQYTSKAFVKELKDREIKISMDGKGRALDNIMIERFWGSLKREKVYINSFDSIRELKEGIREYIDFYNNKRPHQSLNNYSPAEIYKRNEIPENPPWSFLEKEAA